MSKIKNHPPPPSFEKEGEYVARSAPSSSEEGVGGGGTSRETLLERARSMRNNPTEPETRLWMQLKQGRLGGFKFRRQTIIGNRIVDFFCPEKGLAVEVDGDTHDRELDMQRDALLARHRGFGVIRFTNDDVMRNMDGVLVAILRTLQDRQDRWADAQCTTPRPPPLKRRGRQFDNTYSPSFEKEGE